MYDKDRQLSLGFLKTEQQTRPRPTRRRQTYQDESRGYGGAGYGVGYARKGDCFHAGAAVPVGEYTVYPGGSRYTPFPQHLDHIFVALDRDVSDVPFGARMIQMELPDYGGVPLCWRQTLEEVIIPLLQSGEQLYPFCIGSHGRTGTFLASLIALLEPSVFDPIGQVRARHCPHAVETVAQGEAIFALTGRTMPTQYMSSLMPVRMSPILSGPATPRPSGHGKQRR